MSSSDTIPAIAMFAFLAIASVALFSFIAVASWSDARRRERESYYRNDMLKKVAESSGLGATSALQLLREEDRLRALRKRQNMKIQGLMQIAAGLGALIFLHALIRHAPIYLCGILIMLVGAALYGGSFLIVIPEQQQPSA